MDLLKRFYVYELIDPKNNNAFYVGKGQGERALTHGFEAGDERSNSKKAQRIREIRERGQEERVVVIGRFDTEAEAYSVESTLIHWVYGIDNLTNIQGGHGSKFIRPRKEFAILMHLDIPKRQAKNRVSDGLYSEELRKKRDKFEVMEYLESLRGAIKERVSFKFEEDLDLRDAGLTNLLAQCNGVFIYVQRKHSAPIRFKIGLYSISGKSEDKKRLKLIAETLGFEYKDDGSYAKLPDNDLFQDVDKAAISLQQLYDRITQIN